MKISGTDEKRRKAFFLRNAPRVWFFVAIGGAIASDE